jgi:hypothetical protein
MMPKKKYKRVKYSVKYIANVKVSNQFMPMTVNLERSTNGDIMAGIPTPRHRFIRLLWVMHPMIRLLS